MNKICVYTCITGNYDNLIEIDNKEKGIDYLCFTNNKKINSKTWQIIYREDKKLTNVELSRKIKIIGDPILLKYEITIYMDGNQYFKKSVHDFVDTYISNAPTNFISFKHHARDCIYEEIDSCMRFKKTKKEDLLKFKNFLIKEKYPRHNGLIEASIIIKKNNDELVKKTMEMWFYCFLNYINRDQLTFNYCVYKMKMPISYIELNIWDNEWTGYSKHAKVEQKLDSYRLYFGNSENFELEKCIDGTYQKLKENIYSLNVIIPEDTKQIEFEISEKTNIVICDFEILYEKKVETIKFNSFEINQKFFFYDKPVFLLRGNFKKGNEIKLKINIKELSISEIVILQNQICLLTKTNNELQNDILEKSKLLKEQNSFIENLQQRFNEIQESYLSIMNSKSWKLASRLQKLRSWIK